MAEFKFKDEESGKTHTVTAPEGTTEEQAFEVLQQQLGNVPKERSFIDDLLESNEDFGRAAVSGAASIPLMIADILTPETVAESGARVAAFPTVLPSQPSKIVRGTLGLQSAEEVENLGQAFAFGAGEVLAPGAGIGGYLARKTPHMLKFAAETPSRFKAFFARQGAKAGETFVTDPTAFIATEALGGGGARTAEKIAGEDAGPGTKLGAMVVGGVIAQAVRSASVMSGPRSFLTALLATRSARVSPNPASATSMGCPSATL